jgi:outer membrane protein insertion porin family
LLLTIFSQQVQTAAAAPPQSAPAGSWRLASVEVSGAKRFTREQIIAAAGLRVGDRVTEDSLTSAAERLGSSGVFQSVGYRYQIKGEGLTVIYEILEAENLLPCLFDNFVWFRDGELVAALRARVPLFHSLVPADGTVREEVAAALAEILRERKIDARVEHILSGDLGSKDVSLMYRVAEADLPVRDIRFAGASPDASALLRQAAQEFIGNKYSRVGTGKFANLVLLPLYLRRGQLRARFLEATAEPAPGESADPSVGVVVTLPVEEGVVYHMDAVRWSGNESFPAAELDRSLELKTGDVADGIKLDAGWQAVRTAYGKRGFIEAIVRPQPLFDDIARRVAFEVKLTEGPQYKMRNLIVRGASAQAAERLRSAWELKPGDIYNASYLEEFVRQRMGRILATSGTAKGVSTNVHPDREKRVVDVELEIH